MATVDSPNGVGQHTSPLSSPPTDLLRGYAIPQRVPQGRSKRLIGTLLAVLMAALLACGGLGIYLSLQVQARDDQISGLSDSNIALQNQLDQSTANVQQTQTDLAAASADRDKFSGQLASVQSQLVDTKSQLDQTRTNLEEVSKNLTNAGAQREALAKLVVVDNQLLTAIGNYFKALDAMQKARNAQDVAGYYRAQQQAADALAQMNTLEDQRTQLAKSL